MVKRMPIILAATMLIAGAVLGKDQSVRTIVNGVERSCRPPAMMRNGITYIPLRGAGEALGATVRWDAKSASASITLFNKRVRVRQDQGIMVGSSLFLPLRSMGQALDCHVRWDGKVNAVRISSRAWCRRYG